MNGSICFFEPNEALAEKLVEYWLTHGLGKYRICCYSDADKWREDYPELFADLWILDCSLREEISEPPPGRILWWTDCPEETGAVFKYRSAAVLLHMIQMHLQEAAEPGVAAGARLISLYSPIKRCLQTTFGITLAHLLSKKGRILYLNLEGYSGFDRMMAGTFSKDISDFIYCVNQSSEDISFIIQKYIYRLGEVDMIPPVLNPYNLYDITEKMWLQTLQKLKACNLYDYIMVDASDFIHGTFAILRESQVIFSLTKSDDRAEAKWQQYSQILEEAGYTDILEKTKKQEITQIAFLPAHLEECAAGPILDIVSQAAEEAGLL